MKEFDLQIALQRPHRLRQGGLGDVQRFGRPVNPAVVDDRQEVRQLTQVHAGHYGQPD